MATDRSKRTYIIDWDGCGSPTLRLKEMDAGSGPDRLDRHFKTNQVSFRILFSVLSSHLGNRSFCGHTE